MASCFIIGPTFLIFLTCISICKACIPGLGLPYPGYISPYGVPYAKSRASNTHKNFDSSSDACLSRFSNMKLTCADPIDQRSSITEEECYRICMEETPGCRSFQFFLDTGHCEIFAVRPPVEEISVMPFAKDDIVLDSKDSYSYKKRMKRQVCEPTIVPSIGSDVFVPNPSCMGLENLNPENQMFASPSDMQASGPRLMPELPDVCSGNLARIQIIDGIALNGDMMTKRQIVARIQVESPEICLLLCRNNAYLDGRQFSQRCSAVTFDRETGLCLVVNNTITPNGNLQYAPTPSTVYFEKICIPMLELPLGCEEAFYRIPQRVIVSTPDAKLDAPTLNHCIRLCITSLRQRGFLCKSIVYYSGTEWQTHNCLLHHQTRLTNPELVRSELQHEVDYVELPSCMIHGRQHDETLKDSMLWSEWSDCGQMLTRSRYRNCTDCPQRNETEPCMSEKKFLQEFPEMFKEVDVDENLTPIPATRFTGSSLESAQTNQHRTPFSSIDRTLGNKDDQNQYEVASLNLPPKIFDKSRQNLPKITTGLKDNHLATYAGPTSSDECDPMIRCCPYPAPTGIIRGCSVGYQINAENKREPCIPDDCKNE